MPTSEIFFFIESETADVTPAFLKLLVHDLFTFILKRIPIGSFTDLCMEWEQN